MTIKAWLVGRPVDLETLARHFETGTETINASDDGRFYLTSPTFDGLWNDGGRLHATAGALLARMNGLARALEPGFRPVQLSTQFTDDSGKQHSVVMAGGIVVVGATVTATASIDGFVQEPLPSRCPTYLELSDHPDVAEALAILGAGVEQLNWRDHLYRVFEIIRHNVGGHDSLIAKSWASRQDIGAFTVSANSPQVSGEAARHARLNDGVPKRTMSLDEGRSFINRLVLAWLDDLSHAP